MVIVLTRSRAGFFPLRSAFPAFAPGRHPHRSFRGLLELYSRYGPPDCSPTMRGLCREASDSPVSRTIRSPAIEPNHQLFEWVLPPLVISPIRAHAKAPAPLGGEAGNQMDRRPSWRSPRNANAARPRRVRRPEAYATILRKRRGFGGLVILGGRGRQTNGQAAELALGFIGRRKRLPHSAVKPATKTSGRAGARRAG
jgi:hypothetical protein